MAKPKAETTSRNAPYYALYVTQRLSLLLAVASTGILWSTLISIAHGFMFTSSLKDVKLVNLDGLNAGIVHEIGQLTHYAVFLSVVAVALTILMIGLPQVRKHEKRMVIDSLAISGFLLVFAAACQPVFRFILAHVV